MVIFSVVDLTPVLHRQTISGLGFWSKATKRPGLVRVLHERQERQPVLLRSRGRRPGVLQDYGNRCVNRSIYLTDAQLVCRGNTVKLVFVNSTRDYMLMYSQFSCTGRRTSPRSSTTLLGLPRRTKLPATTLCCSSSRTESSQVKQVLDHLVWP